MKFSATLILPRLFLAALMIECSPTTISGSIQGLLCTTQSSYPPSCTVPMYGLHIVITLGCWSHFTSDDYNRSLTSIGNAKCPIQRFTGEGVAPLESLLVHRQLRYSMVRPRHQDVLKPTTSKSSLWSAHSRPKHQLSEETLHRLHHAHPQVLQYPLQSFGNFGSGQRNLALHMW